MVCTVARCGQPSVVGAEVLAKGDSERQEPEETETETERDRSRRLSGAVVCLSVAGKERQEARERRAAGNSDTIRFLIGYCRPTQQPAPQTHSHSLSLSWFLQQQQLLLLPLLLSLLQLGPLQPDAMSATTAADLLSACLCPPIRGDTGACEDDEGKESASGKKDQTEAGMTTNTTTNTTGISDMLPDGLESLRRRLKYQRLDAGGGGGGGDDDGFSSEQFMRPAAKVPYRAICLASFLLLIGSSMIVIAIASFTGLALTYLPMDTIHVLISLGLLMFIPGFYHVRIALLAFNQCPGYSYDDIPDFD